MTQLGLDWSPKRASAESLEALSPRQVNDGHRRILAALAGAAMTDEQLQAVTGLSPNTERPRRGELVEMGLVVAITDRAGKTSTGRRATLWRLK